jgi:hypothetical protein
MRDLFGVALVHLAAISLDEEFRHGGWKQYMASKGRPRHSTRISTSAHQLHCHVERKRCNEMRSMRPGFQTSLDIALFAESKMI